MKVIWLAFLLLLAGCVTPSTMLVGRDGKIVRCEFYGYGNVIVMSVAEQRHDRCVKDFQSIGMVEIPRTKVGVYFDNPTLPMKVDRLDENAKSAGVQIGDTILGLDGQPATKVYDILRVLGPKNVGDKAVVKVKRGEETLNIPVVLIAR